MQDISWGKRQHRFPKPIYSQSNFGSQESQSIKSDMSVHAFYAYMYYIICLTILQTDETEIAENSPEYEQRAKTAQFIVIILACFLIEYQDHYLRH